MKYTLRALLAIGLLAGFYVVGLAIVVALGYAAYLLTVTGARSIAGSVWILVAVVAFAIGRGIFSVQKRTHTDPVGHLVGEADQPELWREARDLAETLLRDPQADLARFSDAMYRIPTSAPSRSRRWWPLPPGRTPPTTLGSSSTRCVSARFRATPSAAPSLR
ncbi:MAG: hypothetical protein QOC69_5866 [Mycobacterium sp.]|nr:hypothetical protein [Mycobacterium sp.]